MAGHIWGAEITYEHLYGLVYRISVTAYVDHNVANGNIDWPQLDSVHVGIYMANFQRDSFADIENDIRINYYSHEITFWTPGNYPIYFVWPNRHGNILNIPNSFFTPFSIRAELPIDPDCPNTSVKFADKPIFYSQKNKIYTHQPSILNPDHDSLSFELDTCLGEYSTTIPGAYIPSGFTIDPVSGEISSGGNPDSTGWYTLAVKISEWKNGSFHGSVLRDFLVWVHADTFNAYGFIPPVLQLDSGGNYFQTLNPGDSLSMQIQYVDSSTFPDLNAFGEAFSVGNPTSVSINSGTANTASAQLTWIPDATHSRPYPYIFTFRGSNDIQQTDLTVLVYVNGPKPDSCYSSLIGIEEFGLDKELIVYPNPVTEIFTISGNQNPLDKIELFNLIGESMAVPINCQLQTANCQVLAPGIYFVKVRGEKEERVAKFVKQ